MRLNNYIPDWLIVLAVLAMLLAMFGVFGGCVQEGAVQVTISADVDLDEVRGITLANQQQTGE